MTSQDDIRFYGRRRGHKLRPGRQSLVDELLPQIRVAPPSDGGALDPAALFPPEIADLWLEIGFGAGEHLAAQAEAHPDIGFIGCEPFLNGVSSLLRHIDARGLDNIRIRDDDARPLLAVLPEACIGRAFTLFLDPWPKKRHNRRRFVGPENLDVLARLLKDGAELRFASDHMDYVRWALFHLSRHPDFVWTARRPQDWRDRPRDGFATRYETKALGKGLTCAYLTFRRLPRCRGD